MKYCSLILLGLVSLLYSQDSLPSEPVGNFYASSWVLFREITAIGNNLVKVAEAYDMEVSRTSIDLVGVTAQKEELKYFSHLYRYVVTIEGSHTRIAGLKAEIYSLSSGGPAVKVAQDTSTNKPQITITLDPPVDGNYMIRIQATKMCPSYELSAGYYFMMIAHSYPKQ